MGGGLLIGIVGVIALLSAIGWWLRQRFDRPEGKSRTLPPAFYVIAVAILVFATAACSDNTERDIASCRAKAMETFKQDRVWEGNSGVYLADCMRAAGYLMDSKCFNLTGVWDMGMCYYPDDWWERWKRSSW